MIKKRGAIAASAVILISCAILIFTLVPIPPGLDSGIHTAIGKAMAQQTLALFKPGGNIVVLRRDTQEFPQPAADVQFRAFEKELRRAHVAIATVRSFAQDPLRPLEVPPGDFFELIRRAPPNTVIVSFLGPPMLSADQQKQLGKVRPKIVAFCSGNLPGRVNLAALFQRGLLAAAIASQYPPPTNAAANRKAAFDQLYTVITHG